MIPIPLEEPRWVRSVELRPLNPSVTHHVRLGVDRWATSRRRDAEDDELGYGGMPWAEDPEGQLLSWTPGKLAHLGTPGTAWRLNPEIDLVLALHLRPSGKPETVGCKIGVHFADEEPRSNPVILRIGPREIDIPAGASVHTIRDSYEVPVDVRAHFIFPHAHSLCRQVRSYAVLPDGTRRWLIRIEDFDEAWHDEYRFATPVLLPRGSRLVAEFSYDNSSKNARNPHQPPRRVVFGSHADDEMADVFLQVTPVRADQRAVLLEGYGARELRSLAAGYRKTLEQHSEDRWSRDGLAACYLKLGEPRKAIEVLEKSLQSHPRSPHTEASLGMAYTLLGESETAQKHYRLALTYDSSYAAAWHGLGGVLAASSKLDAAVESYRRTLKLEPGFTAAHFYLAGVLVRQGRFDEARREYQATIRLAPEMPEPYVKLAEILAGERRFQESLRYLEEARSRAPYHNPAKVSLALYCAEMGELERARGLLLEVRKEIPDHPMPHLFLAQWSSMEKRFRDANRHLEQARSAPLPDNWPQSQQKRFLLGLHSERFKVAKQLQDWRQARTVLADWVRLDPDDPLALRAQRDLERLEAFPPN